VTFKVISTFAGGGGSSLGYKAAGAEVVAAVEWEDHACATYRANHPTTHVIQGDIAKVTGEQLLEVTGLRVGELDLLDGSPPCQGFSFSGKRVLDDPRNNLFREHLRLVDEMEPRNVVIENVAGMMRGKMKPVAGGIVAELKRRGYKVAAGLMYATAFGVAQNRPRVFFIASRVGTPRLPKPLTMPMTSRVALRGIQTTPDEIPEMTGRVRACAHMLLPYERGQDMFTRLGRPRAAWWDLRKLHPDKPCPTILKTPRLLFHWKSRLLTLREALVLTGFPPDYELPTPPGATATQAYNTKWMRIGNAVAPPMTREIAKQVLMGFD
jgi:DNA (cytosine-5)-methyltransferase 1